VSELLLVLKSDLNVCQKDIAPTKPVADGQTCLFLEGEVCCPGHLLEHRSSGAGLLGCLEEASLQAGQV